MIQELPELEPGQESVWDYPHPPRVELSTQHVTVVFNRQVIADTRHAQRVLQTGHPPVYYIPPADIRRQYLAETGRRTECEWKGRARYYDLTIGDAQAWEGAWFYPEPTEGYEAIQNHVAFYPAKMEACYVDGERVRAQSDDYHGGWITSDIVGPFKGEADTVDR